ncbi:MAG: hypothetical protein IJ746_03250 [Ruminococcus sp.]|nr:hypothetical protein [Ruminococcus sp.]
MLWLGIKEFRRRLLTNIFIAMQLAAVFFIVISIVSSVRSRTELYTPLRDILSRRGACGVSGTYRSAEGESLEELVPEIDCMIGIGKLEIPYGSGDSAECYCYDDRSLSVYIPPLAEGSWLSPNARELEAVVNYESGFEVGDIITKEYSYYREDDLTFTDPETAEVEFRVVGRLAKEAPVFGMNTRFGAEDDHRALYGPCTEQSVLICSKSAAEELGVGAYPAGRQIVLFKEGISEEQEAAALKELKALTGFAMPLSELRGRSERYVYEQLLHLAPILISIVILILVSTISVSALAAEMNMRQSAVYALLGCTLRGCGAIYLVSSLLTSLLAMGLCGGFVAALRLSGRLAETVIVFDAGALLWCGAVWGVFLLCCMAAPMLILGSTTIKEQLSEKG